MHLALTLPKLYAICEQAKWRDRDWRGRKGKARGWKESWEGREGGGREEREGE